MFFRPMRPCSVDLFGRARRPDKIVQMCPGYTSDTPPRNRAGLISTPACLSAAKISSDERIKPAKGLVKGGRLSPVLPTAADCRSQARRSWPLVASPCGPSNVTALAALSSLDTTLTSSAPGPASHCHNQNLAASLLFSSDERPQTSMLRQAAE